MPGSCEPWPGKSRTGCVIVRINLRNSVHGMANRLFYVIGAGLASPGREGYDWPCLSEA